MPIYRILSQNSDKDTMNEKRWDLFPDIYRFMLQ